MSRRLETEAIRSVPGAEASGQVHEYFEAAARRWPGRVAVDIPPGIDRSERRVVTYDEIRRQSYILTHFLRGIIAGECVVAILLPRTSELVYSSQLGVLMAGAAYTCIDASFPDEQVQEILRDSDAVVLLTDAEGLRRAGRCGFDRKRVRQVADLIELWTGPVEAPTTPAWLTAASLAYVIYTSGTTGRPKGVMIEHRSVANLVGSDIQEFGLAPMDRVAQGSSPAYDSSVEEMWLALAAGATLVVMDEETVRLGPDLIPWLRAERITVLCPPPTLLRTTGCHDPETAVPDLRLLYVGGEALPRDVADRWARGRRLENGYGPTECTVTALRTRIQEGGEISIGRPIRGLQAWVLDESLHEVPVGEPGELCLGGLCLARGYHNRPELTQEKFPIHPQLGRIYRTGDLVHRAPSGDFFYRGRMDTQVKLRGYRVELEAIEARLVECPGVREAACGVQGDGTTQTLVAFIVPLHPTNPPSFDSLKAALRNVLPRYMVPARFALLSELPVSLSGKINRRALPPIDCEERREAGAAESPASETEQGILTVFHQVFPNHGAVSKGADFFDDLGGDSLSAAIAISLLREDPATASLTVRDLYEGRTAIGLASRVYSTGETSPGITKDSGPAAGRPILATVVQVLWLIVGLILRTLPVYYGAFHVLPALIEQLGLVASLLLGPALWLLGLAAFTPVSVLFAAVVKRVLIGRYRPLRAPFWGSFHVRHWMVQQTVRMVPWSLIEGTEFQCVVLRILGARIGQRVHLHRGVNLQEGGWDLLEIGDDVTIGQDASIRLVELADRQLIVDRVTLEAGCTLEVHSGVGGNTRLGSGAFLAARSALPRGGRIPPGARWDGIPARPAGSAPTVPAIGGNKPILSSATSGLLLISARVALILALALPLELLALTFAWIHGLDTASALAWLRNPSITSPILLAAAVIGSLSVPATVLMEALVCRLMGRVPEGVISRWNPAYVRIWLKTGLVDSGGRWLYGTLFWPSWLRLAGMKVGPGCEISGLIDTLPETVEIGAKTFCADGIYLGGPRLHCGTVTVAPVRLGKNTFLGNGVVVAGGQRLPDNVLLGVGTVADDTTIRTDTAWFGHPPFELPRRQIIEQDRRLTHDPSPIRYGNRVFWELLRFTLPVAPALVIPIWFHLMLTAAAVLPGPVFLLIATPLISLSMAACSFLAVIALKWILLGRVRPGVHALWSCWASRWDFVCMAWSVYAIEMVIALEGTLLLNALLRVTGVSIGRRVVLGGGFAHDLPDPDMLTVEDDATVDCTFQAHTFEDRVLKIDRVTIHRGASVGRNAILLYGAEIGARTSVAPHSVVMKHERLLPDRSYAGFPTRPHVELTGSHGAFLTGDATEQMPA